MEVNGSASVDGTFYRCIVTDNAGQQAISDAAKLTYVKVDFTTNVAVSSLLEYYKNTGNPQTMGAYTGIRAATTATEDYAYNAGKKAEYPETRDGWYLLDLMSRNIDPRNVYLTDTSTGDYIDSLLDMQQTDGGFTDYKYAGMKRYAVEYVLALDIYFDGASTWGNEAEGTSLGRDGAIRWILDQVADGSYGQKAYGGDYLFTEYNSDVDAYYHQQCTFIVLMARLMDDPVYGDEAKSMLFDILTSLRSAYGEETLAGCKNTTAIYADYASALTAAANATSNFLKKYELNNEAAAVCEKLYTALAQDGSYSAKMDRDVPDATGDALATSYVLMALADVSNGSCYLAEAMNHTPDKSYIDRALRDVVIPETAYEDLALAKEGLYGVTFSWSSSNPQVLHNDGTLSRAAEDKRVVLTVTAAYGDTSITKEYTVLVPAATALGADDTHRDLEALSFYPEYISDFELPTEGKYGSTITWASSAPEVISGEGKVVRPAIGEKDATVTLTATATKGDSSESKAFTVLVYAAQDVTKNEGQIKEFNYQSRKHYYENRKLNGYWNVWAAYAALGEYIQDPANGYTYDTTSNSASQPGAHILALVAMGENPYNYNGKDLVAEMIDGGVIGPWSVPVFNSLGLYAAGSNYSDIPYQNACGWMRNLTMGPDIGGWACAVAAYDLDNKDIQDNINYFKDTLKDDMALGTTGSKELSMGCVLTGFGAFMGAGLSGYDVTKDRPWVEQDPVGKIYSNNFGTSELAGFSTQPMMEMSDLYNVMYRNRQIGWIQCGVSKAKLDAQMEKANAILADESKYEAASVQTVKEALEVVKGISEDRLNAKAADYGEEYYTLYDAVRYAKLANQGEVDQAAADKVTEQINTLNDEITLADKEAVDAAKAAYDALTNDQKGLIAEDVVAKLTAAVDTIAGLEQAEVDKEAAANVINEINKINEKVTLDDQSAVAAARAAYDALTKEQKALVTNLDKLTKAEGTIKELLEKDNGKVKNMTDVTGTDWYYNDVAYVLDNNIFKGTSETTFSPNQAMTRAMFVTVLGRNAGVEDSGASYPSTSVFDDVANDAYYASHVKWAVENGITIGVSKTEFAPNAQISRQDMATMMLRYAKAMGIQLPEMSKELFGDDADIAVYAKEAVYKLKAVEIINGKDGNIFDPKGSTTRAEVAAVLHRFLTYKYEDFVKVDDTDSVIVDIEKFTLGQGFIMEPTVVKLQEGDSAADVTLRAAEQAGVELQYRDSEYGFYLSAVRDDETREANIPQYLKDAAEENGFTIGERANADWLSQFDYTSESGWMIWVNHVEISRSAGAWEVTPGTVIRWQFTVCGLGKDLGSGTYGTPFVTVGKKDALVHAMAVASKHQKAGKAYENAVKVMEKMDATQAEINAAEAALND